MAERSGWRDQAISERHRMWGVHCTAVDLDLVLVEYHLARPVALVEYKHYRAKFEPGHANYRALRDLADRAGLPFVVAFYWPDTWSIRVHPMNDPALRHFEPGTQPLHRARVRGAPLPAPLAVRRRDPLASA